MQFERRAGDTLTAVEMDLGDELILTLEDGQQRRIYLKNAWAGITNQGELPHYNLEGVISYCISCELEVDGMPVSLSRIIPSQDNFRRPPCVFGLHIWLDAVDDIFNFLTDNHGGCRPNRKCRLAVWDARKRICPTLLHPWCPLPPETLSLQQCYRGEDTWLGPYDGKECHGGLDINHPAGTPIWAPIRIDEHGFFESLEKGDNNNRWRGLHHFSDGSTWVLQVHHVVRLLVPEDQPIEAGVQMAEGAGVLTGDHEHSHFVFRVRQDGEEVMLDPWLLFWQMYKDREATKARIL